MSDQTKDALIQDPNKFLAPIAGSNWIVALIAVLIIATILIKK